MTYTYPLVSGGYRWNMLKRCLDEVGIEPTASGDVSGRTVLQFDRDLTTDEKTKLDTLMNDNPTLAPTNSVTVFKIKDIWNWLQAFNTATGQTFKLYYSESVPGSGDVNTIELHLNTTVTTTQRTKILSEFAKLIS